MMTTSMKLIILHGWQHSKQNWLQITDMLSQDFDVEAWDLPGFGDEHLVSDDWGLEEYASWVSGKIKKAV